MKPACQCRRCQRQSLIPELGKILDNLLQYSAWSPMDRDLVNSDHGIAKWDHDDSNGGIWLYLGDPPKWLYQTPKVVFVNGAG